MKFCRQCAEYVGEHHKECPNCGHAFAEPAKAKYYCKRCKRELLSKICPIHGVESTIVIEAPAAASSISATNNGFAANENRTNISQTRPLMPGNGPLPKFQPKPLNSGSQKPATGQRPASSSQASSLKTNATGASSVRAQQEKSATDLPAAPQRNKTAVNKPKPATVNSPGKNLKTETVTPPASTPHIIIEEKPSRAQKPASAASPSVKKEKISKGKATPPKTETKKARPQQMPNTVKTPKGVPSWAYWSGGALVLILFAMALYAFYYPNYTRNSLYSRAEELLNQGHTEAAVQLYREYKLRYPGDSAIPEINERINRIQQNESQFIQKQVRIFGLMQKAAEAYNKQQYLLPDEDNAIRYISEILQEDPQFIPALELQNRIVDFYYAQAEAAFDEDRYDKAILYYKNLLVIKPNDALIQNAIDRSLKLKYVHEMLDDSGGLAEAKANYKNLQSEKYKLKTQIREERQRLQEVSRQLENKKSGTPGNSTASDKNPSSEVFVNNKPITAGMALSPSKGSVIDSQWIESLFSKDTDPHAASQEGQTNTESTRNVKKYPVESKAMNEPPVEFKSKKLVTN